MANFNSVSSFNPAFWAREAERSLFVENKAMAIADTTLRNLVAGEGDTVYRVIMSYPASAVYVPGTDITAVAVTGSRETLSIATWYASEVVIDDTEKRQSIITLGSLAAKRMMADHNNRIEQAVLAEVTNSLWSLDDGNVGGTAGNNAVLNTSNIRQVFTSADNKLNAVDAPLAGRTAVVGTHFVSTLKLDVSNKNTQFGDGVLTRGVIANLFGWDILESNNLPFYARLDMTTIPTATDTVTIAGVTFTAAANGTATNAGDFSIGVSASDAITYLVAAINYNPTGTAAVASTAAANAGTIAPVAASFIDLSAENRFLLSLKRRVTATYSSTYLVIAGYGDIVVSETLTPPASIWSNQRQDALFCVAGCVSIVVQIPPVVEVVRAQKQFADVVKSMVGFGKKTYADGAREMVRVKIDASTSDWS